MCYFCVMVLVLLVFYVFFFQAEDGIRDLVRSRGLGDVYKRQPPDRSVFDFDLYVMPEHRLGLGFMAVWHGANHYPVSYTHLTLPTSDLG